MADCGWSYEIKWHLFLRREAVTNLGCMLKRRGIPLPTRAHIVRAMFLYFSVVMCQCKFYHKGGWTLRNSYFWTAILEKTLVSPSGCKESNSVNPKGSQSWKFTGGMMLRQKLQYYGYLIWSANSLENTLMLEKIGAEGDSRGQNGWMASLTQWIWMWTSSRRWRTRCDMLQSMGLWRAGDDCVTEQQIRTSNNKATECIWPWVVSGALDACHRSETLDSDKTQCIWLGVSEAAMEMCHNTETMNVDNLYGVFEVEWMKNHLKCVSQLKHYLITLQMVCLILYRERSTWSMSQHWNWIMINHCVWWPLVVEISMKVCNSTEWMHSDKLRVWSTLGGQRIFWNIYWN